MAHLEVVWIAAAVYSALCLLGLVWVLSAPDDFPDKGITAAALTISFILWAMIFLGLRQRKSWAWWLGALVFGVLAVAGALGALWGWGEAAIGGFGGRHGVGAVGHVILCVLLTAASAFFGYPFFLLLRYRSATIRASRAAAAQSRPSTRS